MLVFIDESGDTGFRFSQGSSEYLTIAFVVFHDVSIAIECQKAIELLARTLHKPPRFEFHFHNAPHDLQVKFLSTVRHFDFQAYSFTLNKRSLWDPSMSGRQGYKQLCGWAFENIAEDLRDTSPVNARIMLDGSGDKRFSNELKTYLKSQTTARSIVGVKDVRMSRPESDPLVQLADYVAGSTNRYFLEKPGATVYSSLLAEKIKSRRIWP